MVWRVNSASCAGVTCAAGKACIVDQLGLPHCLRCDVLDYCPWDTADQSPVCGADGRTYAGKCRLLEAACRVGRSVRLAYRGHCQGMNTYLVLDTFPTDKSELKTDCLLKINKVNWLWFISCTGSVGLQCLHAEQYSSLNVWLMWLILSCSGVPYFQYDTPNPIKTYTVQIALD